MRGALVYEAFYEAEHHGWVTFCPQTFCPRTFCSHKFQRLSHISSLRHFILVRRFWFVGNSGQLLVAF